MKDFEWKIAIYRPAGLIGYDVTIYRSIGSGEMEVLVGSDMVRFKEGETIPPSLRFQNPQMLKELVRAIGEMGIREDHQSFSEGKLEATEKHLEDMRTLVFKKHE